MMDNEAGLQLELFKQSNDSKGLNSRSQNNPFLRNIRNYEKTILIIITIVITGIVSFSLGVEKGKGLVMLNVAVNPKIQEQRRPAPKPEESVKKPALLEKGDYVIRLASYKVKTYAEKEAGLLKKKGLSPLVLSKGSYLVLCVGNITNTQTARSMLVELKKRYRDCYLTRL